MLLRGIIAPVANDFTQIKDFFAPHARCHFFVRAASSELKAIVFAETDQMGA